MTAKEQVVYDIVRKHDDGIGVPAVTYYYHYFAEQYEKDEERTIDKKEFERTVESLCQQGYLEKSKSFAGDDIYTTKTENQKQASSRSEMFAEIEGKFKNASEEEITEIALAALPATYQELPEAWSDEARFYFLVLGVRLGVIGDGLVNDKEQKLIDTVFSTFFSVPEELINSIVSEPLNEKAYELLRSAVMLGNDVAMPFLHFILSFAYIDGVFEDEVAEEIDGIYGLSF